MFHQTILLGWSQARVSHPEPLTPYTADLPQGWGLHGWAGRPPVKEVRSFSSGLVSTEHETMQLFPLIA